MQHPFFAATNGACAFLHFRSTQKLHGHRIKDNKTYTQHSCGSFDNFVVGQCKELLRSGASSWICDSDSRFVSTAQTDATLSLWRAHVTTYKPAIIRDPPAILSQAYMVISFLCLISPCLHLSWHGTEMNGGLRLIEKQVACNVSNFCFKQK